MRPAVSSTATRAGTESSVAATKHRSMARARSERWRARCACSWARDAGVELQARDRLAAQNLQERDVFLVEAVRLPRQDGQRADDLLGSW